MITDRKIFLNTGYQIFAKVIISILGLVSTGYLARYLGTSGFGEYSLVFSFVGIFVIFADFGLGTLLTREMAAGRASQDYFAQVFTLRFLFSTVAFILAAIAVFFFPYSSAVKTGVVIASVGNFFLLLSSLFWSTFQAEFRFEKIAFAQIIAAAISAILAISGVFWGLPFFFFIFAVLVGNFFGFLISLKLVAQDKGFFLIDFGGFKKILSETWPLGAGLIVSVAYFKIDSLILSFFRNPEVTPDLGLYSAAYKPFEVMIVFGGFFLQTLFPFFSSTLKSADFIPRFKKFFYYSLLLSAVMTVLLLVLAKPIILVLGGAKFLPAIKSLQILSLATSVSILAGFFLSVALAGGKQVLLLKFSLIALILNLVLNLIVIPKYSFIGASWTTVVTQIFILLSSVFAAFKVVKKATSKV